MQNNRAAWIMSEAEDAKNDSSEKNICQHRRNVLFYSQPVFSLESSPHIKKTTGIAIAALAHVGIVYALIFGLSHANLIMKSMPLEVRIIQEKKSPPPPLPPIRPVAPKFKPLEIPLIPAPEVMVATPPPPIVAIARTETPPAPALTKAEPLRPAIASDDAPEGDGVKHPWLNVNRCNLPVYPWAAQRDRQQGTVTIAFLIDENGSVVESKIDKSSGSVALDEAARSGLSKCKFMPGTLNGVPRSSWKRIHFVWELPF